MYSNSNRRAHRSHYVVVYQLKIIVNMAIPHVCCVACFCFVFARDYRLISSFLMYWFIFIFSSILHSFTSFPFDNYLFYLVRLLLVLISRQIYSLNSIRYLKLSQRITFFLKKTRFARLADNVCFYLFLIFSHFFSFCKTMLPVINIGRNVLLFGQMVLMSFLHCILTFTCIFKLL